MAKIGQNGSNWVKMGQKWVKIRPKFFRYNSEFLQAKSGTESFIVGFSSLVKCPLNVCQSLSNSILCRFHKSLRTWWNLRYLLFAICAQVCNGRCILPVYRTADWCQKTGFFWLCDSHSHHSMRTCYITRPRIFTTSDWWHSFYTGQRIC